MIITVIMATGRRKKEQRPLAKFVEKRILELHERLEEPHLNKIQEAFEKEETRTMNEKTLRETLFNIAKVQYPDDEFSRIFMKMNLKRNGQVSWDEFISYLILILQQKEIIADFTSLEMPIPKLPNMIKSNHRYPVNKIAYYPTMHSDRTTTWHDGSILSCSRDGTINYWSLDLQLERTVQSTCPELKVQTTWVTDLVTMPDISVVCTSGTERDLRFYDTSARKFDLRIMFTSIEHAVMSMNYVFSENVNEESKLLLGDMNGNIHIIFIQSKDRGAFRSKPGLMLLHERYEKVLKGQVEGFRVVVWKRHCDYVRQLVYYPSLNSIVSCSDCPKNCLIMSDLMGNHTVYQNPKGVWCFTLLDQGHLIACGGADCLVRLWNPFVSQIPTATLYGHHAGIICMQFQDEGKILYSLSKDKCIKVWDVIKQTCIQNYLGLPPELGEHDFTALYNPESRQWIIGCNMIAVLPLRPKQNGDHTDGNSHLSGISVILYNPLFKIIITCGLASYIIVWNPWDGRRMMTIKNAHTKSIHAELTPIEITAATFDPGYQRLLTGAHDGTLKIWNYNTGTCLRNLKLENESEIKCVIWVKSRILAMGWNKRVTEFADNTEAVGSGGEFSKNWDLRHDEEISSAAVRVPQTLVTATYNGDLILWKLETGQPYKHFNVADPTTRIKIQYKIKKPKEQEVQAASGQVMPSRRSFIVMKRKSVAARLDTSQHRGRKVSTVAMPEQCIPLRKLAIHSMYFLAMRPMDPNVGTLMVALENGAIQVWSHHPSGSFMTSFSAIHKAGDYVISMTSDHNNEFLFVGTSIGYIKTFLIKNYCIPDPEPVSLPKYRLMFPFLWKTLFVGRAARIAKNQPLPMLLNSYKAHLMAISGLAYIDEAKLIFSSSVDCSARVWSLSGRYLQTIGTFKPWKYVKTAEKDREDFEHTIPPDLKRVASSTTFRVLLGGGPYRFTPKAAQTEDKEQTKIDYNKIYGKQLDFPVLGNYYKVMEKNFKRRDIVLDVTFPYIPVYQHLKMPEAVKDSALDFAPPKKTKKNAKRKNVAIKENVK